MSKLVWTTEKRKIKDLHNWTRNPRTLSKEKFDDLKKSNDKLGDFGVLVIDHDNTVISGNQRLKVYESKGIKEIDVKVPNRALTDEEIDEIGLRANISSGKWDMDKLANEFEEELLRDLEFAIPEEINDIEDSEEDEKEDKKLNHECPQCGHKFND